MRMARALGLSNQVSSWPTCLRVCGLMPEHLSHGIPKGQVHDFMYGFHSMVLQILRARAHREDVQLFEQPKTKQGRGYPFWQFIGPLPRPEHREKLRIRQPTAQEWRWDSDFRDDLIRWVNELVWIPGKGQVSFMELAMDFECFAAHTLPASPQAVYRATALPLPERARVLKLALTTLQKLSVAGDVLPGGVLTKCSSLVPLGGPTVVGVSARPYFTRRPDMLKLLQNLREYCELRWTAVLQAPPPSPDTRRRRPSGPRSGGRRRSPAPASGSAFPSSNTHRRYCLLCTPPGISLAEGEVRRAPLYLRLTTFQHTATLELPPRGPTGCSDLPSRRPRLSLMWLQWARVAKRHCRRGERQRPAICLSA